ncbi:helix-turn-helix domain-containing protein [Streptobacillus moniliformis]|uniref:helix-turn-helix domain-containing protein n=1 Tax=Streptobacillus moniliformis TaxID=34105 RepID=UPI0007E3C161|nr:helix-turn-helix transcriptional regulator [Streptobacillus moniliformis]
MSIGEKIHKKRKELGYTLEELAVLIGQSKSNLQRYEKNSINIPMDNLEKLAKVLGVSPAYFFDESLKNNTIDTCTIDDVNNNEFYLIEHKGKIIKLYIDELDENEIKELKESKKGMLAFNDKISKKDMGLLEDVLTEMYLKNKLGK